MRTGEGPSLPDQKWNVGEGDTNSIRLAQLCLAADYSTWSSGTHTLSSANLQLLRLPDRVRLHRAVTSKQKLRHLVEEVAAGAGIKVKVELQLS